MPNKDRNIPKRRFKEFENADAWELRKLGEVAEINPKSQIPEKFEYVDLESVVGTSLISHRTVRAESAPSRAQRLALPGDIFYQTVRPYQKNNYLFDLSDDNYVFSTGYAQLRPKIDDRYLMIKIQDDGFVKEVLDRCTGTSYPAINSKDLSQISIDVPTSLPEQEAIGTFFSTLDRQITLHQRKLDKLKSVKQAYLSEMFPAEGERVPKRRFPGFTDDWELRKLGEISTHRGGTAIENHFSEDGKYKVISIGSYGLDNKYIDQKIRAVENEVTRSKVVNKNELTMVLNDKTANGNIIGRCLLIEADDEFVINQRTEIISFNSVIYPKFAYVVLNGVFREQVKKIVQGGTQIYVNYSSVEQLYLSLPSLPEQEAIGTFFSTLDRHITLHQRKLEKLKNLKKALLNELFV
ncbi:restriction endonuclease subunit S [Streptococcus suis]|uniref:Type I restriction modification DNA specificity domain-containing protein n=1 Tax=Streptococcus suis TaxID=1307 RepID=A0A0Z8MXS7_STRSU|nr:restriction endonuclease subunit S [Streptococcus suis]NQG30076.1 restriction endonuclease subunit S [Streptococcus suis]CYW16950.1 type I restriction modification DNA specificity domain-containing protein [Streptococcus suis]